jgi:hypothetical protein
VRLSLYEHPDGVETAPGNRVAYDLERNEARFGAARIEGPALVFALEAEAGPGAVLSGDLELDPASEWVMRCDRVDFPPGAVAYRHVHPGGGIRRLLFGELTIEASGHASAYGAGGAWFEGAGYPVVATACATADTAFVRVLLLPAEWAGKRTVRYLDAADEEKPKLQRATVFLEEPIRL